MKKTCKISQYNRRRSNKTTPRKDRNLSKERIEDPLFEGISRKNKFSVKDKFKYRE